MPGPVVSEGLCTAASGTRCRGLRARRRPSGAWCRGGGEQPWKVES